eukprot:16427219-Heterocapsa_arctica.AAC.1
MKLSYSFFLCSRALDVLDVLVHLGVGHEVVVLFLSLLSRARRARVCPRAQHVHEGRRVHDCAR